MKLVTLVQILLRGFFGYFVQLSVILKRDTMVFMKGDRRDWLGDDRDVTLKIIYIPICANCGNHETRKGAGIAQWYSVELRARGSGVLVPAGGGNFSLHHRVQTCSWGPPSLLSNGYHGLFPFG